MNKIKDIFLAITLTFMISAFTVPNLATIIMNDCNQLYDNCVATAEQEYSNGNYSTGVYLMFVDSICPNAALNCVLDNQ